MNIPNSLTLARIVLVPLVVWLIITHEMRAAFVLFLLAGLSDAADGYLAKRFGWRSELGAYLDPIADKALLVSLYIALSFKGALASFVVILVVSRDLLIVGAVLLSWLIGYEVRIAPSILSKINTGLQTGLVAIVLAGKAALFEIERLAEIGAYIVAATTVASGASYLGLWLRGVTAWESKG